MSPVPPSTLSMSTHSSPLRTGFKTSWTITLPSQPHDLRKRDSHSTFITQHVTTRYSETVHRLSPPPTVMNPWRQPDISPSRLPTLAIAAHPALHYLCHKPGHQNSRTNAIHINSLLEASLFSLHDANVHIFTRLGSRGRCLPLARCSW